MKGINTWAIPLVRYAELFLKWTRVELHQMDQRLRKLMMMYKALHHRLYVSKKKKRKGTWKH